MKSFIGTGFGPLSFGEGWDKNTQCSKGFWYLTDNSLIKNLEKDPW